MDTREIRDRIQVMQIEPTAAAINDLATCCFELTGMVERLELRVAAMDRALKNHLDTVI